MDIGSFKEQLSWVTPGTKQGPESLFVVLFILPFQPEAGATDHNISPFLGPLGFCNVSFHTAWKLQRVMSPWQEKAFFLEGFQPALQESLPSIPSCLKH